MQMFVALQNIHSLTTDGNQLIPLFCGIVKEAKPLYCEKRDTGETWGFIA